MANINISRLDNLNQLRQKTNQISDSVGDAATLETSATNVIDAINEHGLEIGDMVLTGLDASDISAALREIVVDIGDVGAGGANLDTSATDIVEAINEHESDIGSMSLNTTAADLTSAINEHESDIGSMSLNTTATDLTSAINEHETQIGNAVFTGLSATNISAALRELAGEKLDKTVISGDGTLTALNTSQKSTVVAAINELDGQIGSMSLNTTATNLTAAINEHETQIGNMNLTGFDTTDLSAAIREVAVDRGDMNLNTDSGDLTGAINELLQTKVELVTDPGISQTLNTDLTLQNGRTATIAGTLRITGDLIVESGGSGALNITDTFLNLGDSTADNPQSGGVRVLRGDGGGASQLGNVEVIWDENVVATTPAKAWKVIGMNDAGAVSPAVPIVTFYNAKELITNNTESGINVTWDSAAQNFDFNVDDFVITLAGDLAGSATVTNLGNVSLNATIQPDSVALGTDTTGDYVRTITGTANQINVSGAGTEGRATTVSLVANPMVSGITAGAVTVGLTNNNEVTTTSGELNLNSASGQVNVNDSLSVNGNTTLNGDLTVNGTVTTINTQTIELSDNIIVLNNDETGSPTQDAGIDVERGTADNASIRWNETTNRWQLIDTVGTHNVLRPGVDTVATFIDSDGTTVSFDTDDSLRISEGGGIDVNFIDTTEPTFNLQISNTDRGSSQNIFKNVVVSDTDSGYSWATTGSLVANSNNSTMTFVQGNAGVDVDIDGTSRAVRVNHADTSSQANVNINESGRTAIQDLSLTFDSYGHVTDVQYATVETLRVYNAAGSLLF
jgi:hypothetical protein